MFAYALQQLSVFLRFTPFALCHPAASGAIAAAIAPRCDSGHSSRQLGGASESGKVSRDPHEGIDSRAARATRGSPLFVLDRFPMMDLVIQRIRRRGIGEDVRMTTNQLR